MNIKWQYKTIGDVCTVERGGSPRPIDKYITEDENGINWIKIGDTSDSMYITETAQKIIPEGMKKSRYVQPGDFLLSNSMSFGRPYILKIDGCIHDGWLVLRDNDGTFDKRFLYYYLSSKSTYQKFKSMAVGGVVNNLNSEMVRKVSVPVPSISEQQVVADTLDKLQSIIAHRKQQLAKLDELIKARFVEMFGDPLNNDKGWRIVLITEVCHSIFGGGTPPKSHPEYFTGAIPWVSPKDMKSSVISDSIDHITDEAITHSTTNLVPANSVLMVIRSGILKHTLPVAINSIPVTINQDMKAFVPNEAVKTTFLMHYFKAIEKDVLSGVRGVTADNIDFKAFQKRTIIAPPLILQEQFAAFVEQTDKSKVAVQKALDEAQLLFDSLMQEYFG